MISRKDCIAAGRLTAGVDEAGRGPLAGPVVAAAVILGSDCRIDGLADSKALSAPDRERLAGQIRDRALAWSVAWADVAEIDAVNILGATLLAMRRAIFGLRIPPALLIVDGNRLPRLEFYGESIDARAIVRGDATEAAISAASIIAKVHRDGVMQRLSRRYPAYGFDRHKGYPTAAHRAQLRIHGPCPQHRRTFRLLAGES